MHASDLTQLVREHLPRALYNGAAVDAGAVAAQPVLNYGGFVNRSFRVSAGEDTFHVKLTADPHSRRGLETWRALAEPLADSYHAPAMRGWMEIPGVLPFAGPVFEWVAGDRPAAVDGRVRDTLIEALQRLHADRELRAALSARGDQPASCARAYADTYHDRFVEDMQLVRREPPPFLDAGFIAWVDGEIAALAETVASSDAFEAPADAACHRDLWLDNLMVTEAGALFILDWDEMGLGDPMMDWAMLFGPSRVRVRPATAADLPDLGWSPVELERFAVYARASLLDWVIDPLADWIEAANEPLHGAAVRDNNRRVHELARALYREMYRS